ncbi:MAG: TonB-dependent receptor [Asticcacaulis sp.]
MAFEHKTRNTTGRSLLAAALLASTALTTLSPIEAQAQSESAARYTFNIPAQALPDALILYGRQSGLEVTAESAHTRGRRTQGVSGELTSAEALRQLLNGTGLTYRWGSARAVIVEPAPRADNGTIQLGAIRVEGADNGTGEIANTSGHGAGEGDPENAAFRTAGSSSYLSQATVQRFRGLSVGDFLSGTPGVLNGDNRNSGALDINIRGMQGQGRVPVIVDGAMQEATVYRGYAGVAGRSYIDPDLVGGVTIEKGPSAAADASGAIGGLARVRTLGAQDIVAPGGSYGFVVRAGVIGNNVDTPAPATIGGTEGRARYFNRPEALDFRGGSLSAAYAQRFEKFDIVAAFARRKTGNYFGGSKGGSAGSATGSMNAFAHDEQVLNTSQDNTSYLLRSVIRPWDGHSFDLSYIRYESEFGEMMPSQIIRGDGPLQATPSEVNVDTYTARYRYKPQSDLIDLKVDLWATELYNRIETPTRYTINNNTLNYDTIYPTASDRYGLTLSNTSRFYGDFGDLALAYGMAYDYEKIGKSDDWDSLAARYGASYLTPAREGWKRQYSGFVSAEYKPVEWATFNLSTRYIDSTVQELSDPILTWVTTEKNRENVSGWSPIASVMIEPKRGLQLYARYAEGLRTPSLFEATGGWSSYVDPENPLRAEHAHNMELGVNYQKAGLFFGDDLLQTKFSWFNNQVTDYITRGTHPDYGSVIVNIPRVDMRGLELSARYDTGKYFAELAATKYGEMIICDQNDSCRNANSRSGYVTTHLPPTRSTTLTLGGRFLQENLTLGARYTDVGSRPTTQISGTISFVEWQPYQTLDLFGSYRFTDRMSVDFTVDNVTDKFYLDPLSLGLMPAPGRTVRLSLVSRFGDGSWSDSWTSRRERTLDSLIADDPFGEFDGDWTGVYGGIHAGWGEYQTSGVTTTANGTENPLAALESANFKLKNANAGIQFGYNHQYANNWVLGVEIDGSQSPVTTRKYSLNEAVPANTYGYSRFGSSMRYDYEWNASARLRLGYAHDRYLVYGTGGIALINEKQTRTQYQANMASANYPQGTESLPWQVDKVEHTRSGWTLGGGTEVALSNRWSVKAEYSYSYFKDKRFGFSNARKGTGQDYSAQVQVGTELYSLADDPDYAWICDMFPSLCVAYERPLYETVDYTGDSNIIDGRIAKNDLKLHTIRIGLNYRF